MSGRHLIQSLLECSRLQYIGQAFREKCWGIQLMNLRRRLLKGSSTTIVW